MAEQAAPEEDAEISHLKKENLEQCLQNSSLKKARIIQETLKDSDATGLPSYGVLKQFMILFTLV